MKFPSLRFLQAQYGFTASLASVLVGLMAVPMGGGGTFAGGFITKRRRLTRTGVIKMWMFFQFFCIPLAFGFIVFHCGSLPFAGVNQYYSDTPTALQQEPYRCGFHRLSTVYCIKGNLRHSHSQTY